MLKALYEKIMSTAQPVLTIVENSMFCVTNDGAAKELRPTIDHPNTLNLNSLDALIKMVKSEAIHFVEEGAPLYITIPSHLKVQCFTQPNMDERCFRQYFYEVNATDVPGWDSQVKLGFEEMQIALRTRFQETQDAIYAMKLLSDITTGAKITFNDNGIATSVVTQKGVALQTNESIKPIVKLKPYRTFQEVAQPESTFLIRVSERGISFTEADGGMWKLHARETIKKFLEEALAKEIEDHAVYIAL